MSLYTLKWEIKWQNIPEGSYEGADMRCVRIQMYRALARCICILTHLVSAPSYDPSGMFCHFIPYLGWLSWWNIWWIKQHSYWSTFHMPLLGFKLTAFSLLLRQPFVKKTNYIYRLSKDIYRVLKLWHHKVAARLTNVKQKYIK